MSSSDQNANGSSELLSPSIKSIPIEFDEEEEEEEKEAALLKEKYDIKIYENPNDDPDLKTEKEGEKDYRKLATTASSANDSRLQRESANDSRLQRDLLDKNGNGIVYVRNRQEPNYSVRFILIHGGNECVTGLRLRRHFKTLYYMGNGKLKDDPDYDRLPMWYLNAIKECALLWLSRDPDDDFEDPKLCKSKHLWHPDEYLLWCYSAWDVFFPNHHEQMRAFLLKFFEAYNEVKKFVMAYRNSCKRDPSLKSKYRALKCWAVACKTILRDCFRHYIRWIAEVAAPESHQESSSLKDVNKDALRGDWRWHPNDQKIFELMVDSPERLDFLYYGAGLSPSNDYSHILQDANSEIAEKLATLKLRFELAAEWIVRERKYDFMNLPELRFRPRKTEITEEEEGKSIKVLPIWYGYSMATGEDLRQAKRQGWGFTKLNFIGNRAETGESVHCSVDGHDPVFFVKVPDNYYSDPRLIGSRKDPIMQQRCKRLAEHLNTGLKSYYYKMVNRRLNRKIKLSQGQRGALEKRKQYLENQLRFGVSKTSVNTQDFIPWDEDEPGFQDDAPQGFQDDDDNNDDDWENEELDDLVRSVNPGLESFSTYNDSSNSHVTGLREQVFTIDDPWYCHVDDFITRVELVKGRKVLRYQKEPDVFIQMTCCYPQACRKIREFFSFPLGLMNDEKYNVPDDDPYKWPVPRWLPPESHIELLPRDRTGSQVFKIFQLNIDYTVAFHSFRRIKTSSWQTISGWKFDREISSRRNNRCALRIKTHFSNVKSVEQELAMTLRPRHIRLVFDFEMWTDGRFPTPDRNAVVNEGIIVQRDDEVIAKIVLCLNPQLPDKDAGDLVFWFKKEDSLLKAIRQIVMAIDPDEICGHNSNDFDIRYYDARCAHLNFDRQHYLDFGRQDSDLKRTSEKFFKGRYVRTYKVHGRLVTDTMSQAKATFPGLETFSLNALAHTYLNQMTKFGFNVEKIAYFMRTERGCRVLKKYVIGDVEVTALLPPKFNWFQGAVQGAELACIDPQSFVDRGVQFKVQGFFLNEAQDRSHEYLDNLPFFQPTPLLPSDAVLRRGDYAPKDKNASGGEKKKDKQFRTKDKRKEEEGSYGGGYVVEPLDGWYQNVRRDHWDDCVKRDKEVGVYETPQESLDKETEKMTEKEKKKYLYHRNIYRTQAAVIDSAIRKLNKLLDDCNSGRAAEKDLEKEDEEALLQNKKKLKGTVRQNDQRLQADVSYRKTLHNQLDNTLRAQAPKFQSDIDIDKVIDEDIDFDYVFYLQNRWKEELARVLEEHRKHNSLRTARQLLRYIRSVYVLDVASMYPAIILMFNLCPTTFITKTEIIKNGYTEENGDIIKIMVDAIDPSDPEKKRMTKIPVYFVTPKIRLGLLPRMEGTLWKDRKKLKGKLKDNKALLSDELKRLGIKKSQLDPKNPEHRDALNYAFFVIWFNNAQLMKKLFMNSIYGFMGNFQCPLKDIGELDGLSLPAWAISCVRIVAAIITTKGREIIQHMADFVKERYSRKNGYDYDLDGVYGDTDSIMPGKVLWRTGEAVLRFIRVNEALYGKDSKQVKALWNEYQALLFETAEYEALACSSLYPDPYEFEPESHFLDGIFVEKKNYGARKYAPEKPNKEVLGFKDKKALYDFLVEERGIPFVYEGDFLGRGGNCAVRVQETKAPKGKEDGGLVYYQILTKVFSEELYTKGFAMKKRGNAHHVRDCGKNTLNAICMDGDEKKAIKVFTKYIEDLNMDNVPIMDLVLPKRLQRPPDQYSTRMPAPELAKKLNAREGKHAKVEAGTMLRMIVINPENPNLNRKNNSTKGKVSGICEMVQEVSEVIEHGYPINKKFYKESMEKIAMSPVLATALGKSDKPTLKERRKEKFEQVKKIVYDTSGRYNDPETVKSLLKLKEKIPVSSPLMKFIKISTNKCVKCRATIDPKINKSPHPTLCSDCFKDRNLIFSEAMRNYLDAKLERDKKWQQCYDCMGSENLVGGRYNAAEDCHAIDCPNHSARREANNHLQEAERRMDKLKW